MSRAFPRIASTRALPRPGLTTARSPGCMSRAPLRSSVTGTFGAKNGSPIRSLPRFATSTTRRSVRPARSDFEEAPDGEPRARGTEQATRTDQDQRVEGERERIDVTPGVEWAGVQQRRQVDLLPENQQHHLTGFAD